MFTGEGALQPPFSLHLGGALGVSLFFIISGYLITALLLREKERCGKISLGKFYARRALRIFPAFYLYLIVVVIMRQSHLLVVPMHALIASGGYFYNFYTPPPGPDVLGHTWSLSIEEQFYFVWPFVLAYASRTASIGVGLAGVAAWPLLRFAKHGYFYAPVPATAIQSTALDTILWGSLLAIATFERPAAREWIRGKAYLFYLSVVCILAIYALRYQWPEQLSFVLPLLRNVCLTAILWWSINSPDHAVGRLLESRPAVFIGWISYSLYIWHGLLNGCDWWVCGFPQRVVLAFLVSVASYQIVEKPFNRLRSRLHTEKP